MSSVNKTKYKKRKHQIELQRLVKQVGKVLIITALFTGFSLSEVHAEGNKGGIATLYHIYFGGEYIGGLSDETKLNQLKEDKLKKATSEFEDLRLTVGTDLSIVPERVFTIEGTNDNEVLEKLNDMLSVEAKALGININGQRVLYVKNQAAYDEVLRKLKLQAVSEQELNEFESYEASTKSIPPLEENQTRLVKIMMSTDLKTTADQVSPKEVLSVNQAVKLLNKGTLEEKKYVVKSGDVPSEIAIQHGMSDAELVEINPSLKEKMKIQPGDKLNVTILEPYVEVESHFESKRKESIPYNKKTENDSSLYKGDKKVSQTGVVGEKLITELTQKRNGQVIDKAIEDEKVLIEPKEELTVVGTKVMPSKGEGSFKWPTVGGYISSDMGTRWGRLHRGIDIAQPSSRAILASDNGVVVSAGKDGGYGNKVVVDHNNGYKTLYAHLSSISVSVGQTVSQGTNLGVMGATGNSTGVHLHFEVTKNGTLINPVSVLR